MLKIKKQNQGETKIDFQKSDGLIPAIIQDYQTKQVLKLGYMNQESLEKTRKTKKVTFYSRSKQRLWTKGETSNNFLEVQSISLDCDGDTILIKAKPAGNTCHLDQTSCFGEKEELKDFKESEDGKDKKDEIWDLEFLEKLSNLIKQRKTELPETSYTASLFKKGINKIAQKVGEEAVEVVIEAKDNNQELFLSESADLLYHYLILLEAKNTNLSEVIKIMKSRDKSKDNKI